MFPSAETWGIVADIALIFGLPFGVMAFLLERTKQRQVEQEEIYQRLSDEYTAFMRLVIENSDLRLLRAPAPGADGSELTEEQLERRTAFFSILVALFERAYLLVYDDRMSKGTARLWHSWEDFMRDWCKRADFRSSLPMLLQGEDEEFAKHLARLAVLEAKSQGQKPPDLRGFGVGADG